MTDSKFDKMQKAIGLIRASIIKIDKTLYTNTKSLEEHMRRTALLEAKQEKFNAHMEQVKGAGKLIGVLGLLATIWAVLK